MKAVLLVLVLGAILAAVIFGLAPGWNMSGMTVGAFVAMAIGTVVALGLGGGLMALSFYSSRKGYDDRIEVDIPDSD
jgi:hypothetical protein